MAPLKRLFQLLRKYKIFDLIFWVAVTISLAHEINERRPGTETSNLLVASVTKIFEACTVYTIIYLLVPKYMNRYKYTAFVAYTLITLFILSYISAVADELMAHYIYQKHTISYFIKFASNFAESIIYTAVFFAVVTIPDKYRTDQRNKQLEKERLETELNFLKAQINPHFLFNALNSIYVLIEEDKKLATQTLLKFSGLLRYQLYDCSASLMPIDREIEFLNDYIGLEKVRNGENIQLIFNIQPGLNNYKIAPFILIPFIENAFKHISHYTNRTNFINISLAVIDNILDFSVSNTFDEQENVVPINTGGIGLQNVKRRLELLYANAHTLEIHKINNTYNINLQIQFNDDEMYTGRRRTIGQKGYRKLHKRGAISAAG